MLWACLLCSECERCFALAIGDILHNPYGSRIAGSRSDAESGIVRESQHRFV